MDERITLATNCARKQVGAELQGLNIQGAFVNCCLIQRKWAKNTMLIDVSRTVQV